ncbi:MAG: hypothetical protein FWH57_06270 [Oscillospiraceae bacterium]|nr:hypothetical protein [Oscillospiraceae bacterium]
MRLSSVFMPFFTFVAGAAGFYIRLMELVNAFDEETGLPRRGADITNALIAVSIVFLLFILIFSIRVAVKHKSENGFENAFGTYPVAIPIVFTLIGAIWIGATVMYYMNLNVTGPIPATELVFLILSAFSAISVAFFAVEMFQDPQRKTKFTLSVVPSLFVCYWLIIIYRQNAANPVLLSYCYQCLAVIASALGFYYTSGFVYGKLAPGKAVFCYFSAVYFSFVTLADKHALSIKIIFAALIAVNTIHASRLIKNLRWKED